MFQHSFSNSLSVNNVSENKENLYKYTHVISEESLRINFSFILIN